MGLNDMVMIDWWSSLLSQLAIGGATPRHTAGRLDGESGGKQANYPSEGLIEENPGGSPSSVVRSSGRWAELLRRSTARARYPNKYLYCAMHCSCPECEPAAANLRRQENSHDLVSSEEAFNQRDDYIGLFLSDNLLKYRNQLMMLTVEVGP